MPVRTIERTGAFRRDLKRELKGRHGADLTNLFGTVVDDLINDRPLPPARRDHGLVGRWGEHRDCHLKPDLVLIYQLVGEDALRLVRLGSHSELGL